MKLRHHNKFFSLLAYASWSRVSAQNAGNEQCFVCGDEAATIGNPTAEVPLPPGFELPAGTPTITCALIDNAGRGGFLQAANCELILQAEDFAEFCQCSNFVETTGAPDPTAAPVAAEDPTGSPATAESTTPIASPVATPLPSEAPIAVNSLPTTLPTFSFAPSDVPTFSEVPTDSPQAGETDFPTKSPLGFEILPGVEPTNTPVSQPGSPTRSPVILSESLPYSSQSKKLKGGSKKKSLAKSKESKKSKLRASKSTKGSSGKGGKGESDQMPPKSVKKSKSTKTLKSGKGKAVKGKSPKMPKSDKGPVSKTSVESKEKKSLKSGKESSTMIKSNLSHASADDSVTKVASKKEVAYSSDPASLRR